MFYTDVEKDLERLKEIIDKFKYRDDNNDDCSVVPEYYLDQWIKQVQKQIDLDKEEIHQLYDALCSRFQGCYRQIEKEEEKSLE
jgi:hypothetical protein